MTFKKLLSHDASKIILVNLHQTTTNSILPDGVRDEALRKLYIELGCLGPDPNILDVKDAIANVIFAPGYEFQLRAIERPSEDSQVGAVVTFDKVKTLLRQIHKAVFRDFPDRAAEILLILDPGAPDTTVAAAAHVINEFAPRLPGRTFSDANRIWWGAPVRELKAVLSEFDTSDEAMDRRARARALRDRLGLYHINPDPRDAARHVFLFKTRDTLEAIRGRGHAFSTARPSTLDGFDNPRFSQRRFEHPWKAGWGMTVDLTAGGFGSGLPELIATQLSLANFECLYVGALAGANFGSHHGYLETLAPSADFGGMAAELDMAAV